MKKNKDYDLLTAVENECLKQLYELEYPPRPNSSSQIQPTVENINEPAAPDFNLELNPYLLLTRQSLNIQRQRSEHLCALKQSLTDYSSAFKDLSKTSQELSEAISKLQGDSRITLQKQNKFVELSVQLQYYLNYYTYITKFKWYFQCDLAQRYLFEEQLQTQLSYLSYGVNFFYTNSKFHNAKKMFDRYRSEREKVGNFTITFLMKLLSKEYIFASKYNGKDSIPQLIDNFTQNEPKPTVKFLCRYLALFPQFRRKLENLLRTCKYQLDYQTSRELTLFYLEIEEFLMGQPALSLISYIEANEKNAYRYKLLTFFLQYRMYLHYTIRKEYKSKEKDLTGQFEQLSKTVVYVCSSYWWYLHYALSPKRSEHIEAIRNMMTTILNNYYLLMKDILRQLNSVHSAYSFAIYMGQVRDRLPALLYKYASRIEYKVYPLGCVSGTKYEELAELLQQPYTLLAHDIETVMENLLPKNFNIKNGEYPSAEIQTFLTVLPYTRFCPRYATKYVVGCLDQLIKSMRDISYKFSQRYECYVWNITAMYALHVGLENTRVYLIHRQLSVDLQQTRGIIDRVREIYNRGGWWDYAKEFFNVISSGMPVLNELTLDFHDFVKRNLEQLCRNYLKDMTFIYGKNLIEYLQSLDKLVKTPKEEMTEDMHKNLNSLLQSSILKSYYDGLLVSIEKYVKDVIGKMSSFRGYQVDGKSYGPDIMASLSKRVFDNLLELISDFYILTGKLLPYDKFKYLNFYDIAEIKHRLLSTSQNLLYENR